MERMKEALKIGHITLKNRLVLPPIATAKSTGEGLVTDSLIAYYEERAKHQKIGLVITEHSFVAQAGKASANMLGMASDENIPGLKRLTDMFHRYETPVIAQINHAGSATTQELTGEEVVSASDTPLPQGTAVTNRAIPRAIRAEEIPEVITLYAEAAGRVKKAGFDGVEIHAAHGYLLNQFYSPLTNHRTDSYGGSLENRVRLIVEVYREVRKTVGEGYPVVVRLGACDHMEGGNTVGDAVCAAKILAEEGVDLLDISGGMCRYTIPGHEEPGYFGEESSAIRAAVSAPVLLTGGVKTMTDAEKLLTEEKADLIGVGRGILALLNGSVQDRIAD